MTDWQGFDRRRICPGCGAYDTSFSKTSRCPPDRGSLIALFISLAIALAVTGLLAGLVLLQSLRSPQDQSGRLHPALIFPFFILLGNLVLNRRLREGLWAYFLLLRSGDAPDQAGSGEPEKAWTGYHLYCRKCGCEWEISSEEWDEIQQKELSGEKNG
jgi:hypothetical protein